MKIFMLIKHAKVNYQIYSIHLFKSASGVVKRKRERENSDYTNLQGSE